MMGTLKEEIERIAEEIATQDNLATADPIFAVQQRVRDLGYYEDFAEGSEWHDGSNEFCGPESAEQEAKLYAMHREGEDTGDWELYFYRERWEFVQPFFTQRAADEYIAANAHNLTAPRVYVDGAYRNHEWQTVRRHLGKMLTGGDR